MLCVCMRLYLNLVFDGVVYRVLTLGPDRRVEGEGDQAGQQQQNHRPQLFKMDPSQGDMSFNMLRLLNELSSILTSHK